ncbi:hypothetical protein B296_00038770 [Ensete ventricosum]|uniref:Uncharacterized protein n=1 Tax=Ensete ventricosum TaxID=4639 RepID=A0A426ZNB3_ENSVE|nr:hypothetical protein B296_00038770 [Ensete ventricosum]
MGLAEPWYRRGGTSVESSIPCSHGGRALVVKETEEVENVEANSKYQDKAEGRMPSNFIRPIGMIQVAGELDCYSAYISLRELDKSEDKTEKGRRCQATDSSVMGLTAPWYRRADVSSSPYSQSVVGYATPRRSPTSCRSTFMPLVWLFTPSIADDPAAAKEIESVPLGPQHPLIFVSDSYRAPRCPKPLPVQRGAEARKMEEERNNDNNTAIDRRIIAKIP